MKRKETNKARLEAEYGKKTVKNGLKVRHWLEKSESILAEFGENSKEFNNVIQKGVLDFLKKPASGAFDSVSVVKDLQDKMIEKDGMNSVQRLEALREIFDYLSSLGFYLRDDLDYDAKEVAEKAQAYFDAAAEQGLFKDSNTTLKLSISFEGSLSFAIATPKRPEPPFEEWEGYDDFKNHLPPHFKGGLTKASVSTRVLLKLLLRVSTKRKEQDEDKILPDMMRELGSHGITEEDEGEYYTIRRAKETGTHLDRQTILNVIQESDEGSVIMAKDYSRLGRLNEKDRATLIDAVKSRGLHFISLEDISAYDRQVLGCIKGGEIDNGLLTGIFKAMAEDNFRIGLVKARNNWIKSQAGGKAGRIRTAKSIYAGLRDKFCGSGKKADTEKHDRVRELLNLGVGHTAIAKEVGYIVPHIKRLEIKFALENIEPHFHNRKSALFAAKEVGCSVEAATKSYKLLREQRIKDMIISGATNHKIMLDTFCDEEELSTLKDAVFLEKVEDVYLAFDLQVKPIANALGSSVSKVRPFVERLWADEIKGRHKSSGGSVTLEEVRIIEHLPEECSDCFISSVLELANENKKRKK